MESASRTWPGGVRGMGGGVKFVNLWNKKAQSALLADNTQGLITND